MRVDTRGIVCRSRSHGEHGAILTMMTPGDGLQAAYVRGARGRRLRPVLIPGNLVEAQLSSRVEGQLAQGTVELVHSRAAVLAEPLPAAAVEWVTVLTAAALPEEQPYPRIYMALEALLDAIEIAPAASDWGAALVRYELLVLGELGFGLDLERCAVTGTNEGLVAVSPKSGRAVSASEAEPYSGKLLALPSFVREGGRASWKEINDGLLLTGHFLARDVLTDRLQRVTGARARLVDRLRRAGALS